MCIDISYGNGMGDRKPYGFLFKNDLNEFIYSCSRCDEEFHVGHELEQHSIGHDIKEENEMFTHSELSGDLQPTIDVFAESPLLPPPVPPPPPEAPPSSSSRRRPPSRHHNRTSIRTRSSHFLAPATIVASSPSPSPSPSPLPTDITTFIAKTESTTADTKATDELSVYLPFDVQKLELNIENRESDAEQNETLIDDDDDDFTPFNMADDDNNSSSDDDFFTPTTTKYVNKQKEAAAMAAMAAAMAATSTKNKNKKTMGKNAKKNHEYHCDICTRIFTSLARIRQHMIAGHTKKKKPARRPPTPSLCTLCGKYIRDMKTHLKIFHSTERPFKCDYCDATFKQKVHRDTHVRQHTGEKPYICHLCGRSYHAQSVLNAHMNRYHLHLKPHKCDQCGHAYRQLYELRDHINLHHLNQKMHECETCNRRFGTRKYLHQHQLSHGEKRFQCKFCDQKFATTSGRRGHEIRNHGAT